MTRLPSGSSWPRLSACLASAVLPRAESAGADAQRGIAIHAFVADSLTYGREGALERLGSFVDGEFALFCERIDIDEILRKLGIAPTSRQLRAHAEIAMAYQVDADRARIVGYDIGREYHRADPPLDDAEIVMTADLVVEHGDDLFVADLKTGRPQGRADEHAQVMLQALAAARIFRPRSVIPAVIYLRPEAYVSRPRVPLLAADLDAAAERFRAMSDELRRARARYAATGESPTQHEGEHCTHCPAFTRCPAKTALAHSLGGHYAFEAMTDAPLTPERAGQALATLRAARPLLDRVERALREYAEEHEITTPDGKRWRAGDVERDELEWSAAWRALLALYGTEVAEAAVERSASKRSIKDAVSAWARANGRKVGAEVERALAEIERRGGIETRRHRAIVEVKE